MLLLLVDVLHRVQDAHAAPVFPGGLDDGLDVLGKAGAAIAGPGEKEALPDPGIGTDAQADGVDVGARALAETGELVHEADARGQHGVGGVLRGFRGTDIHDDDRVAGADERRVEGLHQLGGPHVVGADDDALRHHAVVHRRPFLEELGVRDDVEIVPGQAGEGFPHLVGGSHRNRTLVDDDLVALHELPDGGGHLQHVRQVGRSVLVGRGPHGDEEHGGRIHGQGGVRGEREPSRFDVPLDHGFQARFIDGAFAAVETLHFFRVDVDADDRVARFRETGSRDQPDIARSKHADVHDF